MRQFKTTTTTLRRAAAALALLGAASAQAQHIGNQALAVCLNQATRTSDLSVDALRCNGANAQKFALQEIGVDPSDPKGRPSFVVRYADKCMHSALPPHPGARLAACAVQPNGRPVTAQLWWFDRNVPANTNPLLGLLRPIERDSKCLALTGRAEQWGRAFEGRVGIGLALQECTADFHQRWVFAPQ